MRRVNARYVIATSTKVNLGAMDLKKYDDAYFKTNVAKGKEGRGMIVGTSGNAVLRRGKNKGSMSAFVVRCSIA